MSKTSSSSSSTVNNNKPSLPLPPLSVPSRFGIVQQGVFRSNTPLPNQIPFLKTLGLKTILSLTPEASHPTLSTFYAQNGIEEIPLGMTLWQPYQMKDYRPISDQLVKETLEMILVKKIGPVLIIDPSGIHLTGIIVGCLRKLQHWNFASILVEYRSFAGPTKHRYSDEQYIEMFDTDLVNIPLDPPEWFAEGERMWREEEEEAEEEV
ncbi:tyrosine phosphatase family-domain-containing protein [Mrakia frigida]|uniref:protein-tyrosine phosphatase family protein n=1 Tax=Mrakia frigida TaxID=29902 RepID=UPI003FCC1CBD